MFLMKVKSFDIFFPMGEFDEIIEQIRQKFMTIIESDFVFYMGDLVASAIATSHFKDAVINEVTRQ